nr:zinc finger, CCHC-type [Tanacetum cinerariifolium]
MGDENPICTLEDYSRPSHEGYQNIIELPDGNNVVPMRSNTIRLVKNGCSFYEIRSEDPNQHLKNILKLVDLLDLDVANRERRTTKLQNEILMFQQHQGESLSEAWTHFKDLLQKVHHHGIDLWLQELSRYKDEGWHDPILPGEGIIDYKNHNIKQLLRVMESRVDTLIRDAISIMERSENFFRILSDMMHRLPTKPSR